MRCAIPVLIGLWLAALAGCGGESNPVGPDDGQALDRLEVVSVEPSHGSVQVGDQVEIRIQFDRPVLHVSAIMVPDLQWMDEDWLLRSADSTTFTRTVALRENTAYQLIVIGALAADSTFLSKASEIVFTTSNQLPTASITGTVETPASYSPEGTVLLLVDATSWVPSAGFGGENSVENHLVALGFVAEKSGAYAIDYLQKGHYYLYAFKDASADGFIDDENDLFGYYDISDFGEMKAIGLDVGEEKSAIDFPVLQGGNFFD